MVKGEGWGWGPRGWEKGWEEGRGEWVEGGKVGQRGNLPFPGPLIIHPFSQPPDFPCRPLTSLLQFSCVSCPGLAGAAGVTTSPSLVQLRLPPAS